MIFFCTPVQASVARSPDREKNRTEFNKLLEVQSLYSNKVGRQDEQQREGHFWHHFGPSWSQSGPSWGHLGQQEGCLGAMMGYLGQQEGHLRTILNNVGPS